MNTVKITTEVDLAIKLAIDETKNNGIKSSDDSVASQLIGDKKTFLLNKRLI
jgi:hypothetical protein